MIITLSPMRRDDRLEIERRGETLLFNGVALDLSGVEEGDKIDPGALACPWLAGPVTRRNGVLEIPVVLPHGVPAPEETLFPRPLRPGGDGPVPLPPYETPQAADPGKAGGGDP